MIVVVGNDPHINGRETEDRTTLDLPAHQERLWRAAHAANPRTVLAVTSAYPYALTDAAAALPALLWTAHGGQAAGTALARILSGDVSPAVSSRRPGTPPTRSCPACSTTTSSAHGRRTSTTRARRSTRSATDCRTPRSPTPG